MDGGRREAIVEELQGWRETHDARRGVMEDRILSAEQAVSRAEAAMSRAFWVQSIIASRQSQFGPISRRLF